jgi:hypothetical protein
MKMIVKVSEQTFTRENKKDALIAATKWVASTVLSSSSNVEASRFTWNTQLSESDDGLPTCTLILYTILDDTELSNQRCKACKEFHKSFYINDETNCNLCKQKAYREFINEKGKALAITYNDKLNL